MRVVSAVALSAGCLFATTAVAATPTEVNYTFTLAPGASRSFPMPADSVPVTLTASLSAKNGGTQTPSALITAVIAHDKSSKQLTWIGVNGDGSQAAGNTVNGSTVASFASGNAVLTAAAVKKFGELTVTQSSSTTSIPITYYVTMTY